MDLWPAKQFRDAIWAKATWQECIEDDELLEQIVKRNSQAKTIWDAKPQKFDSKINAENLRPWQQELDTELREEPDDRKVIWYTDTKGGAGKTAMARYLAKTRQVFIVQDGSKMADIAYAYSQNPSSIVIFDLARSHTDVLPYDQMEKFKNGYIFVGKYQSRAVHFKSPHVVVFSNMYPEKDKLSEDRWDIRDLGARTERDAARLALGQDLDDTDTDRE